MKRLFHINCTPWVRQLEDFSSGCSSGFFALGQWLLASLLALFAGINLCFPPGVPMGANASVGDLRWFGNGGDALKSPASIWRSVVFITLVMSMMVMGRGAWADTSFACNGITKGLVACYPFDGDANDASGNGNHGTVHGATLTKDRFGQVDSAYFFNGNGNHILVQNAPTLNSTPLTISVWAKIASGATSNTMDIVSKDGECGERQYLITRSPYGHFRPHVWPNINGSAHFYESKISPIWEQWYHIVQTYDGNSLKIYVDGQQEGDMSIGGNIGISSQPLRIGGGAKSGCSPYWFKGIIDDLRIYNRALSEDEIKQLYQNNLGDNNGNDSGTTLKDFSLEDFSDVSILTLNGNAKTVKTSDGVVLRLVPADYFQVGSAFSTKKYNIENFSTLFKFRITNPGNGGADGLAFVVQSVSPYMGDATGGNIGYGNIQNSVGVEFDIYNNQGINDPDDNHVGININGSFETVGVEPSFDNGNVWYAWVDYNGEMLEIRANQTGKRPSKPLLARSLNITEILGGTPEAFIGFTAATGGSFANHDILSWMYRDKFDPIDGITYNASGKIHDKERNPLPGVTIQIDKKTTVTDETGYWQINGLQEGEYTVIASKDGYRFETTPCVVSNNVDTCQPKIKGEPLLDVKVVPEPRIAKQGENVTYRITVTNQYKNEDKDDENQGTATNVTLVDTLPENAELVSLEALDGGNCDAATLTCELPDLTPGATANLELVVSNRLAETLVNTVTVTTQEYPTEVKKIWTSVVPYLSVTLSDQPDPVTMLNVLHYRLVVALNHYAPSEATGVTLVSQLPQGVELKSIHSDYGACDTSALPQITCKLDDLNIASADSISQATVEMDVELIDGGLLLLTHEAKVTANEYPAHQTRERTTIFIPQEIQVDLAMVVDVTGSMQEEMNGVIKALKEFTDKIDTNSAPLMTLITFGDEVKVTAFTRNIDVLRGAIEDLTASGGGLCEEASVEALLVAIPHTKAEGEILFSTDASPYADANVEKVIKLLKDKAISFNAIITGDCSMKESWNF